MPLPGAPPIGTIPAAFDTWADNVYLTAADHNSRIGIIEAASYLTSASHGSIDHSAVMSTVVLNDLIDVIIAMDHVPVIWDLFVYSGAVWHALTIPAVLNFAALADLGNVAATAPSDGQVLTWDTGTTAWRPETPAAGFDGTAHDAHDHTAALNSAALADLGNVAATAPSDGQVLTFDTTNGWQPETPGSGSQTPWAQDVDANQFKLIDVGRIQIGATAIPDTTIGMVIRPAGVSLGAGNDFGTLDIWAAPITRGATILHDAAINVRQLNPAESGQTTSNVYGVRVGPFISPGPGTVTRFIGVSTSMRANEPTSKAIGLHADLNTGLSTITEAIGVEVESTSSGAGGITTAVGLRINNLAVGTNKWAMQIGDYNSYHQGKINFGTTSAPGFGITLGSTAQDRGVIALAVQGATPTNPATLMTQSLFYFKGDSIVFAANDGGTIRYKYLVMTGTGVTWTHSTTPP